MKKCKIKHIVEEIYYNLEHNVVGIAGAKNVTTYQWWPYQKNLFNFSVNPLRTQSTVAISVTLVKIVVVVVVAVTQNKVQNKIKNLTHQYAE